MKSICDEKKLKNKCLTSKNGFTLVELIVVLVILAIVAAIAVPTMLGFTDSAREKEYTSDAEAAKKAAQSALNDIYNDASNQLTPSKRTDIASIAGLDIQNSQFKVWTAQKLIDGVTPCTIDNIGSFTIRYALYKTSNDDSEDSGKYVFFDGKNWTVCNDREDLDIAMGKVNATEQDDTIIHLWPNSTNGTQYADSAYNPTQEEENWNPDEEDDKETYVLKLRNYNSVQGKNEPGVLFKIGNLETNLPDTLSVEFEQDAVAGMVSKNWTEANRVEIKGNVYTIECVDGFENLRWSTKSNPAKATDADIYTYQDVMANISTLKQNEVKELFAFTDKTTEERNITFRCVENSNSLKFGESDTQYTVTVKRYTNRYDCDTYSKNSALNSGENSLSEMNKSIKLSKGCKLEGWAFNENGSYENASDSSDEIKSYSAKNYEEVWKKVFNDKYTAESITSCEFVGITKKVTKVTLLADEKGYSSFKGDKSIVFEASINELLRSLNYENASTDNFDEYESKKLDLKPGFRLDRWEKYRTTPAENFNTINDVWEEVRNGSDSEYSFIAKVSYGSRAKFLTRKSSSDYADPKNLVGQIRTLFGDNNKSKSDVYLYLEKKSYSEAVNVLKNAGLINMIMTGYENSDPEDDIAIECSGHSEVYSVNKNVDGGTIQRLVVMWDGNDETYSVPIFAYNVVKGKTYHAYWFSREDHPELQGDYNGMFDKYLNIDFSGSCMEDWNTSSCTNMNSMFKWSGFTGDIDFTKWDFSSVTDMHEMFYDCKKLTSISFEGCNMPNCTNFSGIFGSSNAANAAITTVNLNKLYTPNLTNISDMFKNTNKLTEFSAKGWDARSITSLQNFLNGKTTLTKVDLQDYDSVYQTNLSSCTTMNSMLKGCSNLTSVSFEGLKLDSCTSFASLFEGCSKLTTVNLNKCVAPQLNSVSDMFKNATALNSFSAKGWQVGSVSFDSLFSGRASLSQFDISDFDEDNKTDLTGVTSMKNMFYRCTSLQNISLQNARLDSCTTFESMFKECSGLISVNMDKCYTPSLTIVSSMFNTVANLTSFSARGWQAPSLTKLEKFMYDKQKLVVFDISGYDEENKTDLSGCSSLNYMLQNCKAIQEVSFEWVDLSSCKSVTEMLSTCSELEKVSFDNCDMSAFEGTFGQKVLDNDKKLKIFSAKNWDMRNASSFEGLFDRGKLANQDLPDGTKGDYGLSTIASVDFTGAKINNVKSFKSMFTNCPNLSFVSFKNAELRPTSDTTPVDTYWMFFHCFNLQTIDFSFAEGTTLHPGDMFKFFDYCLYLETIVFSEEGQNDSVEFIKSKFDTTYATHMSNLFYHCECLDPNSNIYEALEFNNATDAVRAFYGAFTTSGADLNKFELTFRNKNMSKLTDMREMFYGTPITKVTFIDCDISGLSSTSTLGVAPYSTACKEKIPLGGMFSYSNAETIEFVGCDMSSTPSVENWFAYSTKVKIIDLRNTDLSSCTNKKNMTAGCPNPEIIYQ